MSFSDFLPDLALGGISSLSGIVGGISNIIAGNSANRTNLRIARETNQAQMALAQYQADRNLDLWNLNNAYNTPSAQMERYKAAGLNPNLMYGQGTSGNSSSPAQGYQAPTLQRATVNNSYVANSAQLLMNGLIQAAEIKKKNAETEQIYQNTQNLQTDNRLRELQIAYQAFNNSKTRDEAEVWKSILQSRIANLNSSTNLNESNQLTNDALRPLLIEQKTAEVQNLSLHNQDLKFALSQLRPLQKQELIAKIANYAAQTDLYTSNSDLAYSNIILNEEKLKNLQVDRDLANAQIGLTNQRKLTEYQSQELNRLRIHIKQFLIDNGVNIESANAIERLLYGINHHIDTIDN